MSSRAERGISQSKRTSRKLICVIQHLVRDPFTSFRMTNPRSHPRPPTPGIARVFHWPAFGLDLGDAGAALYFHDLIPQQSSALEFEIRGSLLHFFFELAEQFGEVEITAGF